MTNTTTASQETTMAFPIWITDRNNTDRVVKLEESNDGEGIILTVRDEDGSARRYYAYDGGAWALSDDGTLGRQLIGTSDVTVPRDELALRRFFHDASSEDVV